MDTVIVNSADWAGLDCVPDLPDGWLIANAPRPIQGHFVWQGPFLHGIFYAAAPAIPEGTFGWEADDAYLVTFTTNTEIEQKLMAKLAEYGYASFEDAGLTREELAGQYPDMPWHSAAGAR